MANIDEEKVWRQFGATIGMLSDALRDCPDGLGEKSLREDQPSQRVAAGLSPSWYLRYHTLFWLDLFLTGAAEGFSPPTPLDPVEMERGEATPRIYAREELLHFLQHCRRKCKETIRALSDEHARRRCRFAWGEPLLAELQPHSRRHVQWHGVQLRLFLGQRAWRSVEWVPQAE